MKKKYNRVLTIAGSDSGGGAGIQADIKAISVNGCYAASAITAVTVQNTLGVQAVHPVPLDVLEGQIEALGIAGYFDALLGQSDIHAHGKLEIARAIATSPKLLLLDEPAAGMNPQETAELVETIRFVQKTFDMTVLLIEHDMSLVSTICDRVTVLNFGQVLAEGPVAEVLKLPEVVRAYLGDD